LSSRAKNPSVYRGRAAALHQSSNTIARWTRSKGLELFYPSLTTVNDVEEEAATSKTIAKAWLHQMEYDGNNPPIIRKTVTLPLQDREYHLPGLVSIEDWILYALGKEKATLFHNVKRGRYWEVCVEITPDAVAQMAANTGYRPPVVVHGMAVSQRIALLLLVYGPLSVSSLAKGLSLSTHQVRGGAGLLVSKGLVKRDVDPYTPTNDEQLYEWLRNRVLSGQEYNEGGNLVDIGSTPGSLNRWQVVLVEKPWLLSDRRKAFRSMTSPQEP